jgi:MinD-like ATPase involved in chromosome partitioning or flagellar assembly
VPVMAVIPHDINVLKAQANFTPYTTHKPKSEATREFEKLASSISGEKYTSTKNLKDFFINLKPKPQEMNRIIYYEKIFN